MLLRAKLSSPKTCWSSYPSTCKRDLIWKQGLCRWGQSKMRSLGHVLIQCENDIRMKLGNNRILEFQYTKDKSSEGDILLLLLLSHFSHVQLCVTPQIITCQAPLSVGFSRQKYWSGLPFSPPRDLPHPGTNPTSPALGGGFFTTEPPGKPRFLLF